MLVDNATFEKHYRIGELAEMWGLGRETVRKLVKDDPGVIKIRMGRKHAHTVYSVPESAARRIHTRLADGMLTRLPSPHPLRGFRHGDNVRFRLRVESRFEHGGQPLLTFGYPRGVMLPDNLLRVAEQLRHVAHGHAWALQQDAGEGVPETVRRR